MIMSGKKQKGFTMIELIVFIVVTGILMSTLMLAAKTALQGAPSVHYQWVAMQLANQCMENFIEMRRINGYSAVPCPSSSLGALCSTISGYAVSANVSCTTWNGDANYKTITVTVTGLARAQLSLQIGDY